MNLNAFTVDQGRMTDDNEPSLSDIILADIRRALDHPTYKANHREITREVEWDVECFGLSEEEEKCVYPLLESLKLENTRCESLGSEGKWKLTFHLRLKTGSKVYGTLYYFAQEEPNAWALEPYDFYRCDFRVFKSTALRSAYVYED